MRHCVRITVLKKEFYPEMADEYLVEGRAAGPCPLLEVGDSFVYEGGAVMPEGFCPWAWIDLYNQITDLSGRAENNWYKPGLRIGCCTDGVRPVVFRMEGVDRPASEED